MPWGNRKEKPWILFAPLYFLLSLSLILISRTGRLEEGQVYFAHGFGSWSLDASMDLNTVVVEICGKENGLWLTRKWGGGGERGRGRRKERILDYPHLETYFPIP